jgi:hypothetical protein
MAIAKMTRAIVREQQVRIDTRWVSYRAAGAQLHSYGTSWNGGTGRRYKRSANSADGSGNVAVVRPCVSKSRRESSFDAGYELGLLFRRHRPVYGGAK